MSDDADEPVVLKSWPQAIPDPVHGWLYYRLGSYQETGRLIYEPNITWTAARLAQPWRYEQQKIAWEEVDRAA